MMKKATVFIGVCILSGSLSAYAQQRIFTVSTEEVRMDILVTVDGKPLDGLNASDFEIYDNGVRQKIEYVRLLEDMPIEATLILDMSRSVVGELLDNLKTAAHKLLEDFRHEDRVALITFNQAIVEGSPLTRDRDRIKTALDQVRPFGNSSLIDASYAGLVLAESGSQLPLVIIFSDGLNNSSWLSGSDVLETAKRNDSVVYAISTQLRPDKSFLADLTEITGGTLFEVEYTRGLEDIFLGILKEFRKRYLISYRPQGVSEEGWHKLEVRTHRRSAEIRTRSGYMRGASVK